ncbi:MAG: hypothetical protein RL268_282 [Pseudomonadota bacterium]|jgi:hypothetical protein
MSGEFSAAIGEWVKKVGGRADEVVRDTIETLVFKVDERSPVGDPKFWKSPPPIGYVGGQYRANNVLSVDARFSGVIARPDPSGRGTVEASLGKVPEQAAGHVYYIQNNTPYAWAIEDGTATPRQAPYGVYGRTVLEFNTAVRDAVISAKAKLP